MDQKSSATDGSGSDDSFEVLKENSFGDEVSKDATVSFSDLRLNLNPDDKTQSLEESSEHSCTEFDVSEILTSSFVLISNESCKVSQSNCNSCNKGDDTVTKDANTLDESLQKVNESVTNEGGGTSKHELGIRATYGNINPGKEDEEGMCGNVDIKAEPFTKMNAKTSDNSNDHDNMTGNTPTNKTYTASSDRKTDINKKDELKEINDIKEIPTDKTANDDTEAKEILPPSMIVNILKENEQSSFPSIKSIEMKSTEGKTECKEFCKNERPLNEEKSKAVTVDTSHQNDAADESDGNSRPESISSCEFEKEETPLTLPDGSFSTDYKGNNQHTGGTTTHLIKGKAALDELVVAKEPGELPDSTVQTNASQSNASTGFKKPEIAATTAAKITASVAIDDQSNQFTSTPGTSTATCLKEEDTKHVQTVPDASFKKEKSLERTLEKCMAVKCIFGDVKLIKVGQLNIMDINGVKTKLPQSINKDVDLRLEKQDDAVILLTEKVCFEVKLVEERIVLNTITRRYFADPTRPLLPVENEKMCMEDIDDNEQQRSTKICQDENTAGLGADGFDNERASVNSQNINSTTAPKAPDGPIDPAASSAKHKEVATVDKPKIGDQLLRDESPFKETLTDDVIKGKAKDDDPNNIFDKASSKLQTVTSKTSCIPKVSKMNEKDDLPSLNKLDSDERPVDAKSRSFNEKGNDEDKVECRLTRREDTQQTFDERTKNELLQTDEFEGKLGKDEYVAENLNAAKGLSTSTTGKTDVGTEMPYKKCMAVSCKFGDVRLIKVATLHIMDVNGKKSNLPKSVHKDKDLRLEKRGDTVFLLTGSVYFEVNFYNERLQLTNISSSFFTSSTGQTLQGETKALDRHSSENSNESQEKKIGSKESLENSNNSAHDSTVQTNASQSNASTGFKKPEIAATTAAKITASVAIDDQSNQFTSTPGTSTATCLKEEDTKHVQTVPDASFKKEKSLERTLEKCMAVKCIFGDVKLIKVGQLNIMDINGVKTKLPQSINKDVDLRLEKQDDAVILLTEKVCFEVKLVEERIVLNTITRRYFADPTRPLLPVENEKMCMEDIDDNEQQRSTKICQDENTAGLGADGFDNERASVNSQNINSTTAPKAPDGTIDPAASSAKHKEVATVDKPKIGDQLLRDESPFKETLTDDVIKGKAKDDDPNNIFDKASSKLQTVTSKTSCIPKVSKMNEKDDLPSLNKLDSDERPVDAKSRSFNEKGNDEDKVECRLTRREDTQQTFDERTKNELLQTDEFEGKLGKDEYVAENLNAAKGLSTSTTGKTDVGTEMPYKKCMAVSCKFGDVRLIKVATLHIMDVNGKKSNLPKSVHKDKDLRLEKRGDTVFLLTGSVYFEVNFYNERLQLTNISSSFTSSTGQTLQGETKALDRHSSENSNESQEKKIGSKESLENSNNSAHDSENAMKSRQTSSLRENDSQKSESTDQDVNFSPTRGLQVEKLDFAKVRDTPTGCIHDDHSDHHDIMSNPERCSSPIENDDQESVQSSGGQTIFTDIPGERLDGEKKITKRVPKETFTLQDSSDAAVNADAVHSGDTSGPFNVREGNEDNCDLHDQHQVSLNRVVDETSGKGEHETNVQTADTGTCSESKTDPINGNTEKSQRHEDMMEAEGICKRKQPEDRAQQRINPIGDNEVDEIISHILAMSIDGSKSAKSPEQDQKEFVPHTEIPKVNPAIRYPPNPGEGNTLGMSKTTHMVPNKDALPKAKEKQVEHAFKVRFTIENKPAEIKTFTITSTPDDYMRWKFFIKSHELRINLSRLTIDKSVLDIHFGPTICEIATPLENDLKVPIICQRLTDDVMRFCSHIVVKDITEHSIASTIDRKELYERLQNKGIYFEIIKNSIMIAYEKYKEEDVFKMLQGKVDSVYLNETKSNKRKDATKVRLQVDFRSHLPLKDIFEGLSLAKKLENMFPSLLLQIKTNEHGVCIQFEGEAKYASNAKKYLQGEFIDTIHRREIRIPLVGSEVLVKTNLCGLINKSLGTNALLMIEHSKPILYSLDENLLEKATTHICTKCIENKDVLLVNSWRHADAIMYLVDTYTQLQDGVLIQVNRRKQNC